MNARSTRTLLSSCDFCVSCLVLCPVISFSSCLYLLFAEGEGLLSTHERGKERTYNNKLLQLLPVLSVFLLLLPC